MTLKRASSETQRWIERLRSELSHLPYDEPPSGVWADFKNGPTGHNVARLRPSKSHIVAYLKLEPKDHPDLAPARTDWDFHATFTIRSEDDLSKARDLILTADREYEEADP